MDLFDYADMQENIHDPVPSPDVRIPEIGDRVKIPSIQSTGIIEYIDHKTLFVDHYFPIQVKLDVEHDLQFMYRTNLKDLEML